MRFSLGRPREEASDKKGECPYCAAADIQAPSPAVSTSNEGTQAVHARPNQRQYHPLKETGTSLNVSSDRTGGIPAETHRYCEAVTIRGWRVNFVGAILGH